MHKATCSECGNECEVPFKPVDGRPVRCNKCFKSSRENKSGRFNNKPGRFDNKPGRFDNKPGRFNNKQGKFNNNRKDFDVVCSECGKKTTVPFKPTQGKPVLCRDCFRR